MSQGPYIYQPAPFSVDKLIEDNLRRQQLEAIPSPALTPEVLASKELPDASQFAGTPTGAGITPMQGLAAAQVVAGLLGGIMKAKQASKERKANAAQNAAQRESNIRLQGAQMENAALQSLMSKLK